MVRAPKNARHVEVLTISSSGDQAGPWTFVRIRNPVHGPITPDQAMVDAAHLIVAARAAGSRLDPQKLVEAIVKEGTRKGASA